MALLDESVWRGKVFLGGEWVAPPGGEYPVVEPATGATLGTLGKPSAQDVARAAESAAAAQLEWAATPYPERAAVLRRAGALWAEHRDEISWWNIREVGAIPPIADFALVVLDDADVDQAATLAAFGSFFHQGQICMTTGRHIVHERLYDDFVERLSAKAAHLPVGNPATDQVALGPVIDARQRDKIHGLVTASRDAGAKVAAGGEYDQLFYQATVLADSPPTSPAFTDEVFGPVAPVTRYSSVDEAVRLATASDYGLSLGIVTRDVMKGLALAVHIPTGIVHINDQTVSDEANVPFGGVGASGTGARFGGAPANVDAFTETRWVTVRGEPPAYPF